MTTFASPPYATRSESFYTTHNIVLADGSQTNPKEPILEDAGICKAALRTLELVFPPEVRAQTRVADLGCLEGGYAVAFARAGFQTVGVEIKDRHLDLCQEVQDSLGLPNLTFVKDDVRNLADHGEFDAVFACGIIYHLDKPVEFLNLLGKQTRRLLILQTHFSEAMTASNEGRAGHWYTEPTPDEDMVGWGSNGNAKSFWLGRLDLLASMRDAGFDIVAEQMDFLDDILTGVHDGPYGLSSGRSMFVGIKS